MKIPGIDVWSMVRLVVLAIPVAVVFGPLVLTFLVLGMLFIKPLTLWHTRRVGPPLMNQSLIDERKSGMLIMALVIIGSIGSWLLLNKFFPDEQQRSAALIFLAVLAVLVWVRPSMAVVPVLCMTAFGGTGMLLAAAPLVIMFGRRDQRRRLGIKRSVGRTAATLVYSLAGFLTALLFANASAGMPPPASESASGETPASPTGDGSWFDQFSDWMFQRGPGVDTDTPSRPVQVPGRGEATPPTDSTPWHLWLIAALAAAALVAAVVWFRRRRRNAIESQDPNAASTLARLEAIGTAVGRPRASNEGALTFASELATHTGDRRLDEAGPLVSGDVYGSNAVEPQLVSSQLSAVESNPPPPPPAPPLGKRFVGRVRTLPVSRRGVLVSIAALAGFAGLAAVAVPDLGDLRDPVDRELAYVEQADAPDEWHELMGTPARDLFGWETCSSGYDGESLGQVTAGLSHRSDPLGAQVTGWGDQDGIAGGAVNVGTDAMTASIGFESTGAAPSLADDPWYVGDWLAVPLQPFSTIDAVLETTSVRDPIRADYVDRNGDHFARFESLPPDWNVAYDEMAPVSPMSFDSVELMRVVDIWTDETGVPIRVRMIDDGPDGQWSEWRRIDNVNDARLVLPTCESERPWANDDWIGIEPWTPSRVAPLLVQFDERGNPYDTYGWSVEDVVAVEPGGMIEGPLDVLSIGDLNSVSPDTEAQHEHTFDLSWEAGADIISMSSDGWPAATRIDAVGETVVAWDEFEPFFVYESFVTLVTATTFPEIELDKLDVLLEPLWDGATHVTASVDDRAGDELTLVTQSDTTSVALGRNDQDEVVSILVWADWFEWREFGFEGTPPQSVLDRESQLLECLAGERTVDLAGRCSWG